MKKSEQSLTERLRLASRKDHRTSMTTVLPRIVVAITSRRQWASAVTCFYYIHRELDCAVSESQGMEQFAAFLAKVKRKAAIEADLKTFYGPAWQEKIKTPSGPVLTYLERLKIISKDAPYLLLAHCYGQHMALLAGGQYIRRLVRGSLQIVADEPGTAIFDFEEPAKQLKQEYKSIINALPETLREQEVSEFITEHRLVFKLNEEVITTFPVSTGSFLAALVKLIPPEIMLLVVSTVLALMLAAYSRKWLVIDPDTQDFANPNFVST